MDGIDGSAALDLASLVERALQRDQDAWRALVDRLKGVAWKVLYNYDMSEDDRKDAFASTFFRLYERLSSIREPEKLPGWVATTARNEAHTSFRKRSRTVSMESLSAREEPTTFLDDTLLDDELRAALRRAFSRLPNELQALMRLLTTDPPLAYDEISRLLDIPRGSIGPMRQRCLERLRSTPELAPYLDGGTRGRS